MEYWSIVLMGADRYLSIACPVKCLRCEMRSIFQWGEAYFTGVTCYSDNG